MRAIPYGADVLFEFPLLTPATNDFMHAFPTTIAAGDVKVHTDTAIAANPTARLLGFDSGGTAKPSPGDTIVEASGDGTGVVMFIITVSGTWAGGDAAGFIFIKSHGGTWTDNINIDNSTTAASNVATVDAGVQLWSTGTAATAGLFGWAADKAYVALTSTETACKQGSILVSDQTATELWIDTGERFTTVGHESAYDTQGCILTDTCHASSQTTTNIRLGAAPTIVPKTGYYFEVVSGTGIRQAGHVRSYNTTVGFQVVPNYPLTTVLDNTSIVKYYISAARSIAGIESIYGLDVSGDGTATPFHV